MAEETNPIEKALERRKEADYQAFLKLKELIKMINYDQRRKKFIKIISEYTGDEESAEEFIKEVEEVLEERDNANGEFLKAVSDSSKKIKELSDSIVNLEGQIKEKKQEIDNIKNQRKVM